MQRHANNFYTFGRFHLDVAERRLSRDGQAISLTPKAFDTLLTLVQNAGHALTKDELMRAVWPDGFVEEVNLAYNISILRKALADGRPGETYIETVPKLGYRFVAPVGELRKESLPEARRRTNLPAQVTRFIGRERELAEVSNAVTTQRLVTLVGAAGMGKTRLALETGDAVLNQFPDGVWLVELAPVADEALMLAAVASAFGLSEQPERSLVDTLIAFIAERHMLLLLDNCEHVIETSARLAERLLRACPNLHILATSREALRLAGEVTWRIPPLSIPDLANLLQMDRAAGYDAVRLFVEHTTLAQPGFTLAAGDLATVTHICHRLDGMPLAIEMAAALVPFLGLSGVAAGLDDRLALLTNHSRTAMQHHQTLRATLDWSYNLLTESERELLLRLSVFVGGWTAEAAQDVCGCTDHPLLQLARHSLVVIAVSEHGSQRSQPRYRLLETIRQYAHEKLEASGEANTISQRHADYFLRLAEAIQSVQDGDEKRNWYTRLDVEQDNLRAALGWALVTGHADIGLRLAAALGDYWFWWTGQFREGWSWISQLLALPEAKQHVQARANALKVAVNLVRHVGDSQTADRIADESLALFRGLGDKAALAWVLADKGCEAWSQSDFIQARTLCAESAALFREAGEQRGLAWALCWLAATERDQGHVEEATAFFEEGVMAAQTTGADEIAGVTVMGWGHLAYNLGDYARADVLCRQALALCQKSGDADGANYALVHLARITLAQGDIGRAAAQFEAGETGFRQAQQKNGLGWVLYQLGYVKRLQGDDQEASALLREALTIQQQLRHKLLLIESLERCAWVAADRGQFQQAAQLFGAVEAARGAIGAPLPQGDMPLYGRHLAQARTALDANVFDQVWAEGAEMTLEQAVEFALAAQAHD